MSDCMRVTSVSELSSKYIQTSYYLCYRSRKHQSKLFITHIHTACCDSTQLDLNSEQQLTTCMGSTLHQ